LKITKIWKQQKLERGGTRGRSQNRQQKSKSAAEHKRELDPDEER